MDRASSPHLTLAKNFWRAHLKPSDFVIDMTCGNGHDTQFLAELVPEGLVYSIDIQECALEKAKALVGTSDRVRFFHQSHAAPFPLPYAPKLIVYNLGYLPGGDKTITTMTNTTLTSVNNALDLLGENGALSITCYPGHVEGLKEEQTLIDWAKNLPFNQWHANLHQWINRKRSPSLLWITKRY